MKRLVLALLTGMLFAGCAAPQKVEKKVEDHCDIAHNQMPLIEQAASKQLQDGSSVKAKVKYCSDVIHDEKAYVVYTLELFMLDDPTPYVRIDLLVFFRNADGRWVPTQEIPFSESIDPKLLPKQDNQTSL